MNPDPGNPSAPSLAPSSVPPESPSAAPPLDASALFLGWAKILLARNPFYIVSAGLLVWSMRRLSLDSRIFSDEFPQLVFNVSSFQLYEFLLVATAIVLARRRIWYDSGLLVGLENLFLCAPFLLVSQALLLENQLAIALCAAGGALAVVRFRALRRELPGWNAPGALMVAGAFLLAFNFGWPVMIRMLHKSRDYPVWEALGVILNRWQWNGLMPAAVGFALFLPVRQPRMILRDGEEAPFYAWRSFPLLALLSWVAGTCVHLYCISFVYGLPWGCGLLGPTVWMTSWALWRQCHRKAQRFLVFGPMASAIFAACAGSTQTAAILSLLNTLAFGGLAAGKRDRLAAHLSLASALLAATVCASASDAVCITLGARKQPVGNPYGRLPDLRGGLGDCFAAGQSGCVWRSLSGAGAVDVTNADLPVGESDRTNRSGLHIGAQFAVEPRGASRRGQGPGALRGLLDIS